MAVATYRIQFNSDFTFSQAQKIIPYLNQLGIDTLYASPILKYRSGGSGYDTIDCGHISSQLGGYKQLKNLSKDLKSLKMDWLQDIVPNHMSYSQDNPLIKDIFYRGSKSAYARYFDIDWKHPSPQLKGRLLAPFLGQPLYEAFRQKKIRLVMAPGGLSFRYYRQFFPLSEETYPRLLGESGFQRLDNLLKPPRINNIYLLYKSSSKIRNYIDQVMDRINKNQKAFLNLADEQHFKLSNHKMASELINYRRFFTINHLISTSTEKKQVFEYMHRTLKKLTDQNIIQGVRIDHIDGLYNPLQYLKRLKSYLGLPFMVVEKILGPGESLSSRWPVYGTTGYDYLNQLNGIFCLTENSKAFDRIYSSVSHQTTDFNIRLYRSKKMILTQHMQGDLDNLGRLAHKAARREAGLKDFTVPSLTTALVSILSAFPVYRTYVVSKPSSQDQRYINIAARMAASQEPKLTEEIKFIAQLLTGSRYRNFTARFQQMSGPLMAKGYEDTLLYRYNRLLGLNEVGSSPERFGNKLTDFYRFCQGRQSDWPLSLNATSTHDSKRGEDARLRLNVLSEIPADWRHKLKQWIKENHSKKTKIGRSLAPDLNDEYLLYQAMIGSWGPGGKAKFRSRMKAYIIKAVREAKVHTAWIKPDREYEQAFTLFLDRLLADQDFMTDFKDWVARISYFQSFSTLSHILVKITSPGIPDFYQGTELWDLNLVDPDNRRPVNYYQRVKMLQYIKKIEGTAGMASLILNNRNPEMAKLFLIYRALHCRARYQKLFTRGSFRPLKVHGKFKKNIIAFSREYKGQSIITIAPRFFTQLIEYGQKPLQKEVYKDTRINLPLPYLYNQLTSEKITGGKVHIGDILNEFPVALLYAKGGSVG